MSEDIYYKLAEKLDEMPHGFPHAENGVEIKILRWIFRPEEAEIAYNVSPIPEPAEAIALRLNKSITETIRILDLMCKHGQLISLKYEGVDQYVFQPWVPGLWESQYYREDRTEDEKREFSALYEEYYPTFKKTADYKPANARTIPVGEAIKNEAKPHRLEDVHRMIDDATSLCAVPCVCRIEKRIYDNSACKHSVETVVLSNQETNWEKWPPIGRVITKEEAHKIMDDAEAAGLIHNTWNADDLLFYFICNCCTCCCVLMRAVKELDARNMVTSNFVAHIDPNTCAGCGTCAEQRCRVNAITNKGDVCYVNSDKCIGCGVCLVTCQVKAITLIRKPQSEVPPTALEWAEQRIANKKEAMEG